MYLAYSIRHNFRFSAGGCRCLLRNASGHFSNSSMSQTKRFKQVKIRFNIVDLELVVLLPYCLYLCFHSLIIELLEVAVFEASVKDANATRTVLAESSCYCYLNGD